MKRCLNRIKKQIKGTVTIMVSVILIVVLSLGSLLMELGRYESAQLQINEANLSASNSILAYYNITLQQNYGLFALDEEKATEAKYQAYLFFNSDMDTVLGSKYYGSGFSRLYGKPHYEYAAMYNLSNPNILKRQILEYSKYNIPIHVASDFLDIDKKLEEFGKQLSENLSGLNGILKLCDAVNSIYEAFEKIAKLNVIIANLGRCEDGGNGFDEIVNFFNEIITSEKKTYKPTYNEAYAELEKVVGEKVTYLKENSISYPGDNAPFSSSQTETQKDKVVFQAFKVLLKAYKDSEIFGGEGKAEPANESKEQKALTFMESLGIIENLDQKETVEKIREVIKYVAKKEYNYEIKEWTTDTLEALKGEINDFDSENYLNEKSKYDEMLNANTNYQNELAAWEEHQKKLNDYDTKINKNKTDFETRCTDLIKLLGEYSAALTAASGGIDSAIEAAEKLNDKEKKTSSDLKKIREYILNAVNNWKNEIVDGLSADKTASEELIADRITSDYTFSIPKRNPSEYYLDYGAANALVYALQNMSAIEQANTDIINVFSALKDLAKILSPVPEAFNITQMTTLSQNTISMLPSYTGTVYSAEHTDDKLKLNNTLNDVKNTVSQRYWDSIDKVNPNGRAEEADLVEEIEERLNQLVDDIKYLTGNSDTLDTGFGLFKLVCKLHKFVTAIKRVVNNIIFFMNNFSATINQLLNGLYENLLLSSYIMEKFPNRVDTSGKAYKGSSQNLFGLTNTEESAFSVACVEYILNGNASEARNQSQAFWYIFLIRLLNNVVCVLTDETAMSIISATGPFAVLVFPLWVYYESNVDMNLLLMGEEVPLIKMQLYLSVSGIKNLSEHLSNLKERYEAADIDSDKALSEFSKSAKNNLDYTKTELIQGSEDDLFDMKYSDYLWLMLLFKSNKTKVMRTADLIQMDLRYQELYGSKSKGKATFLMTKANTYIRTKCTAEYNSILPVFSLKENGTNGFGWKVGSLKYTGY